MKLSAEVYDKSWRITGRYAEKPGTEKKQS